MITPSYSYYNKLFRDLQLPLAWCDLDMLLKNCDDIAQRASGNKTLRIASKSVRCTYVLKKILESNPVYQGIMSFSGREALFLLGQGFDDILLGYPIVNKEEIFDICVATRNG